MKKILFISSFLILFYSCKNKTKNDLNLIHLNHIAENINHDLKKISGDIIELSNKIQHSIQFDEQTEINLKNKYQYNADNIFNVQYQRNESAVFFPANKSITSDIKRRIIQTEKLNPLFDKIIKDNPLLAQMYFLDTTSFLRIYPYINVVNYLNSSVDLTEMISYKTVENIPFNNLEAYWVNTPFADPYGRGWVISCSEPIYYRDKFIGVISGDVTLKSIKTKYFSSNTESFFMTTKDGKLVCCTKEAAKIINISPCREFQYFKPVIEDIFIFNRPSLCNHQNEKLKKEFNKLLNGNFVGEFLINNTFYKMYKSHIPETDWYLFKIIN